jgi:hypothetical protein
MKRIIFLFLLLLGTTVKAQEDKNIADLDFLYQAIQQTPSYKDQFKGDKKYRQLYESLRKDLKTTDELIIYQQLLKLIYPLKDNHLGFYGKTDSAYKFNYLKPAINKDELENKYANTSVDDIVGFYSSLNGKAKAVVYEQSPKVFYLQNLNTSIVEAILNQLDSNSFDVIRFANPPFPYLLFRNVRFRNGRIDDLGYKKIQQPAFNELVKGEENFEYRKLEEEIGYLRLSSFATFTPNIKKATSFFEQTKSQITTANLIVDIRNNGGGGYKVSRQFINFLTNYNGKVYILQNGFSVSNAEQFVLNLRGRKHITTLGETTKGTITYGSNYGKKLTLPSGRFVFGPTDMKGLAKELVYESLGIAPDIILDPFTEDWIVQTLKYIKAND